MLKLEKCRILYCKLVNGTFVRQVCSNNTASICYLIENYPSYTTEIMQQKLFNRTYIPFSLLRIHFKNGISNINMWNHCSSTGVTGWHANVIEHEFLSNGVAICLISPTYHISNLSVKKVSNLFLQNIKFFIFTFWDAMKGRCYSLYCFYKQVLVILYVVSRENNLRLDVFHIQSRDPSGYLRNSILIQLKYD